ncbi:nucleotidyltransferase family protein [Rhizobium sp. BT03]|uniref:nucleotidyltransferase family protein n=1 Tax=Rhizobium sp. BT03 TaxID=3045156 RepID=UPI0024B3D6B6|nr:nucleotidyltransferase family protein [Rhizobium sp. BT03]WHO71981.1 nucleotidyltransferase family protein [Rhizobium sp. BT03]
MSPLLRRWHDIALPDAWLVAGAIAQTVWNHAFAFPLVHGINDIDIVYFDASDLSEEAEADHAARIQVAFSDLPIWIDVKNEARVHLWYEAKFGYPIEPYISTTDAIATFPTTATAVGIRPGDGGLELCAPFGLSDLLGGIVRANTRQITREVYERKVDRWINVWPNLTVVKW